MHMISLDGLLSTSCGGLMSSMIESVGGGWEEGVFWSFVDWRFICSWSRYIFAVAMNVGRLFAMRLIFKPGHDANWPCLMALTSVDGDGLNRAPDIYCAGSLFICSTWIIPFSICFGEVEAGDGRGGELIEIDHKPISFRFPVVMTLLCFIIYR